MSDLKPCPFCGTTPVMNEFQTLITIGCNTCGVSRAFKGALSGARTKPVATGSSQVRFTHPAEDYDSKARDKAIEEWNRRSQPEATAPAQDLSAAITDDEIIRRFEQHIDAGPDCFSLKDGECAYWIKNTEVLKFARALASSANALSAGDRVDAEPTDSELLDFVAAHPEMTLRHHKRRWSFVGFTNYEYDAFKTPREAISAAILQSKNK